MNLTSAVRAGQVTFLDVLFGMASGHPDWDLVEAARRGDRAAFGELWTQCRPAVHSFALRRTSDPWLAEDVTSETFTRALRALDSVTYQGRDVAAWLRTIARNIILDHYKSSQYQRERLAGEVSDWADPDTRTPERVAVDREAARELHAALAPAVASLTADQRQCVRLRFVDELSQADIAQIMGRAEPAVKALQHRAIATLRKRLNQRKDTA